MIACRAVMADKWESMKATLSSWPSMSLDQEGTFKYVLIEAAAFMEVSFNHTYIHEFFQQTSAIIIILGS